MAITAEPFMTPVDAMVPRSLRVVRRWAETTDTFSLALDAGPDGFTFEPGQFNMVYAFGVGEVAISISGNPAATDTIVHTIRRVGAVTRALGDLNEGDHVGVRGPFGVGWPLAAAHGRDVVLVGGGIGLAPLRSAVYHVLEQRDRYQGFVLNVGFRSPAEVLYENELRTWRSRFDLEVELTVDSADEAWRGPVGVVTKLIPRMPFDPAETVAMICGPEIMMRFTVDALQQRGLNASDIHLSMERNMKCAVGLCGHCQFGPSFVCTDGPVYRYDTIEALLRTEEV